MTKPQLGCLVHRHLGHKFAEGEGDGLAKVAVGGVADQGGAGVGVGVDEHGKRSALVC
jgi:hypothetical protein